MLLVFMISDLQFELVPKIWWYMFIWINKNVLVRINSKLDKQRKGDCF